MLPGREARRWPMARCLRKREACCGLSGFSAGVRVMFGFNKRDKVDPRTEFEALTLEHMDALFGAAMRNRECLTCGQRNFVYLDAKQGTTTSSLCGRNAVQVVVRGAHTIDLAQVEAQLEAVADGVARNDYLLRAHIDGFEFTVFPDNRAIIKGTDDEDLAKTLFAKYIGS